MSIDRPKLDLCSGRNFVMHTTNFIILSIVKLEPLEFQCSTCAERSLAMASRSTCRAPSMSCTLEVKSAGTCEWLPSSSSLVNIASARTCTRTDLYNRT